MGAESKRVKQRMHWLLTGGGACERAALFIKGYKKWEV